MSYRILKLLEKNPYPDDVRVRREARTLADAGHRVIIICPAQGDQPLREEMDEVLVYRFRAPLGSHSQASYVWEYALSMLMMSLLTFIVLLREGFDVIHMHNLPDTLICIAAPYKLLGKRVVYDHHDLGPEMYDARFPGRASGLVRQMQVFFEKLSCRLSDHVVSVNESYKSIEMGRGGIPENRITIVRGGPDERWMSPVTPDAAIRVKASTILAYVGVMGVQDGIDYLLRSLGELVHTLGRHDFVCVMMGDGHARQSLQDLTVQLSLDEYVEFTGWITLDELLPKVAAADICLAPEPSNPYNDSCTTVKLMEYMAMSKPIVAFDLREHRASAGGAAVYATPNDELDYARVLALLMDDPGRRMEMGAIGRRRVDDSLSWKHQGKRLLQVYANGNLDNPRRSLRSKGGRQ